VTPGAFAAFMLTTNSTSLACSIVTETLGARI